MIQLPSSCFAEDEGSLVNSGRWLQWHWPGQKPPGEAKLDTWIMAQIFVRVRELYRQEGGTVPEPILNLSWDYADEGDPTAEELARELNGRALAPLMDATDPTKVVLEQGKQLLNFSQVRDDGTTMCACWIYSGCWNENGNNMARRDNEDPDATGAYAKWAFAWPLNRRILYNRASCDMEGKPWDPSRKLIEWDGAKWSGYDVPDISPTAKPDEVMPFIMNQEGVSRLFTRGMMRDGPFPTHMEPFEAPIANVLNPQMRGNPVARVFESDVATFASLDELAEYPYVGDLLPADRALPLLDQAQPGELGAPAGVLRGDLGRARRRQGDRRRRLGARLVEARRGVGQGRGHQAAEADDLRRQDRPRRRHPAALGLHRRGAQGLGAELADALRR